MNAPLVTDAGRPLNRALHLETLKLLDGEHTQFDLQVPGPAVLRHAYARPFTAEQRIIGGKAKTGILVVLVFEIDPHAAPVARRYYVLPYGQTAHGAGLVDWVFAAMAALPNGAPIAIYDMPPA